MYQRLQGYARLHSPDPGSELRRYLFEYQREIKSFERPCHKNEVIKAALVNAITLVGDYHTLPQAQRTLVRILRATLPKLQKKPILIALEWLRPEDNMAVASYLRGEITEERFLHAVRFQERWGFDWKNYRVIFDFVKAHGLSIFGIAANNESRLQNRDRFAADRIASIFQLYPSAHVFVLVGDLHLASCHLPKEIKSKLSKIGLKRSVLTVHQNIDHFFWMLAEKGLEYRYDVVEIEKNNYCVLNTPPWLKLQSHLKWMEITEHSDSDPDTRFNDAFTNLDFSNEITEIVRGVQSFFEIEGTSEDLDIRTVGPEDLSFLKTLELKKKTIAQLEHLLKSFESFSIPKYKIIFLTNLSPNQLASQSTLLLHSKLSGFQRNFSNPAKDFYAFVWVEGLAYLGSKILNPKRKCNSLVDLERIALEKQLRPTHHEFKVTADVALFTSQLLRREPRLFSQFPRTVSNNRLVFYYKSIKILGHLLGQGLYQGALEGTFSKKSLRALFYDPLTQPKALYREWISRLDARSLREQSKHETL